MDIISSKEYLSALADLNKSITQKKYMLKGDISESSQNLNLVQEIDEKFKKDLGFGISDIRDTQELIQYENRVSFEYSIITNERLLKYSIDDEINLLKKQIISSPDFIRNFQIQIGQDKKDFFKELGITIPAAKSLIRNSSEATIIPDKEDAKGENFFLKSEYKKHNIFIHLGIERNSEDTLVVHSFLLLKKELTEGYSPIRLFLNVLNIYGLPLRVGLKTKKFYTEEKILPNHFTNILELFEVIINDKKESHYITSSIRQTPLYFQIKFVYGINTGKYFRDFRRGAV